MKHFLHRINATISMLKKEACLAGVPYSKLLMDVLWFRARTGLGPRYYVVAGMARNDFPVKDKWLHISARKYYWALGVLNPPIYRKLMQNKVSEKALYQLMHIPTAKLLGYYHVSSGFDAAGNALCNEEQLEALVLANEGRKVCIKPVEGWGGSGVVVGTLQRRGQRPFVCQHPSGDLLDLGQLLSHYRDQSGEAAFFVEDFLEQSAEFMRFNQDSLNTVRVWVLEGEPGTPEVIGAYLRVGRVGAAIDNASAGGIMFPIDIRTGKLLPGLTKHTPHRENIHEHPDHHGPVVGHRLEDWKAIIRLSQEVVARLPETRFAGLDVTMTEQGPVLVEANVVPDKDGAAHANIPSLLIWQAAVKQHG